MCVCPHMCSLKCLIEVVGWLCVGSWVPSIAMVLVVDNSYHVLVCVLYNFTHGVCNVEECQPCSLSKFGVGSPPHAHTVHCRHMKVHFACTCAYCTVHCVRLLSVTCCLQESRKMSLVSGGKMWASTCVAKQYVVKQCVAKQCS